MDTYWETNLDFFADESTEDLQSSTVEDEQALQFNSSSPSDTHCETNLTNRYSDERMEDNIQSSTGEDELALQFNPSSCYSDGEGNLDHSYYDESTGGNVQSSSETSDLEFKSNLSLCVLGGVELAENLIFFSALNLGFIIMRICSGLLLWIIQKILGSYMNNYDKLMPCVLFPTGLMASSIGVPFFTKQAYGVLKASKGDHRERIKPQMSFMLLTLLIGAFMSLGFPPRSDYSPENFCEMTLIFYNTILIVCAIIVGCKAWLLAWYPQLNPQSSAKPDEIENKPKKRKVKRKFHYFNKNIQKGQKIEFFY